MSVTSKNGLRVLAGVGGGQIGPSGKRFSGGQQGGQGQQGQRFGSQ